MKRVQSTIKMVNIKENRMLATEIKCDIKDSGEKNYYIQNSKLEELKKVSFENNTYYGLFNRGEYILVNNEKICLD